MFLLCLQYDYEYDEHGERVILGKGTFGVVYAGRDLSNQVRLAIKEIPERDSRSVKCKMIAMFVILLSVILTKAKFCFYLQNLQKGQARLNSEDEP